MIFSPLLVVILAAQPAVDCPLMAPPDAVVSCPGWGEMTCRVRNGRGELVRSRSRIELIARRYGRQATADERWEHVRPLRAWGCDVPWNLLLVTKPLWAEKVRWERDLWRGMEPPR